MQTVHRQADGQAEIVFQGTEVGRHQLLQRRVLKDVVGAFESVLPVLWQVQAEDRLIDLHPLHALAGQAAEDFAVDRQQTFQQVEFVEIAAFGLAQPQVGQRPDQYRLYRVTESLCFGHFIEQLFPTEQKALVGAEFRDQIVIVGVEPLGQLLRILRLAVATAAAGAGATSHGEQGVEGRQAIVAPDLGEALGDRPEGQRVGQDLVVPGKIADRQQFDTGVFLQLPVAGAQFAANSLETCLIEIAFPVGFLRFFQFAVSADARETKVVGQCHEKTSSL
ncbi:hypothetical protein D3C80_919930 [compost metagenome]